MFRTISGRESRLRTRRKLSDAVLSYFLRRRTINRRPVIPALKVLSLAPQVYVMGDIKDYDDRLHRVASASAAFQRGIYHLYLLVHQQEPDAYASVLRTYQCLYLHLVTMLLLDFSGFSLNSLPISRRFQKHASDGKRPTRREIDPAALVTHTTFEDDKWKGFSQDHPLSKLGMDAKELYGRTVEARHNLLYRPFLLNPGLYRWEDCRLMDLLQGLPQPTAVEQVYRDFAQAVCNWQVGADQRSRSQDEESTAPYPAYILELCFLPYEDEQETWPKETLLLRYARLLTGSSDGLLQDLREYRNHLLDLGRILSLPGTMLSTVSSLWRVGEV
jgi:hypothetical protein